MAGFQNELIAALEGLPILGMRVFGKFIIAPAQCPAGQSNLSGKCGLLIGNVGGAMWTRFAKSQEYCDGQAHSMDRWTRRELLTLANSIEADVIFPFDRPYWPFQQFLSDATGMRQTPLGLYIHPEFGLWQGLRGALILPNVDSALLEEVDPLNRAEIHPCDTCAEKYCVNACPVDAFNTGLNVECCYSHLDSGVEPNCMSLGCQARDACPHGAEHRYSEHQLRFHMASYRSQ